jgi:hypothetical protein
MEVNLESLKNSPNLAEISHGANTVHMFFSKIINNEHVRCSQIIKCKDFFQDLFWSRAKKNSSSIYGFAWSHDKENETFSKETLNLVLYVSQNIYTNRKKLTDQQWDNSVNFLSKVCQNLNYGEIEVDMDSSKEFIIFTFDKRYTEVPYVWSWFLMMLRLSLTYDNSEILEYFKKDTLIYSTNDKMYVRNSNFLKNFNNIMNNIIDFSQKWTNYDEINTVHNSTGVLNYVTKI